MVGWDVLEENFSTDDDGRRRNGSAAYWKPHRLPHLVTLVRGPAMLPRLIEVDTLIALISIGP